jgi:gas vesicle protein
VAVFENEQATAGGDSQQVTVRGKGRGLDRKEAWMNARKNAMKLIAKEGVVTKMQETYPTPEAREKGYTYIKDSSGKEDRDGAKHKVDATIQFSAPKQKDPQIIWASDISEDAKDNLPKNVPSFKNAIKQARENGIANLVVAKGEAGHSEKATEIATRIASRMGGKNKLNHFATPIPDRRTYVVYVFMSGPTASASPINPNAQANSQTTEVPAEANNPQAAQAAKADTPASNANTQGDQKEPASGQTDAAPVAQANPTPLNPSQPAGNPQTAPAAQNVAVNQTQATPAAQTTPKPAQAQTPRQIPQAINNIAQRVGAQVRTNRQGFPVIRKGNLLTTFNTRDKWVSFYDLTKKQRVASFRYADDNALARRANATVKSINDLSRASG